MNYFLIAFFFVRLVSDIRGLTYRLILFLSPKWTIWQLATCAEKMANEKAILFCSKVEVYGNQFQACIWQYLCGWSGTFVASNKTAFVRYLDSRLTGRHCPKPLVQCQNINKPAGKSSQHDVQPQGRLQCHFHKFWLESFCRWIKISVNLI